MGERISETSSKPSTVTREYVYGRTWSSWFFWWILKLFLPILKRRDIIAPRGPQTLDFPPPNLGACTADRWTHAGWTMVSLTPPPVLGSGRPRPKRVCFYMYGAGFQRPIHSRQWGFASYLAEKLDAEMSVIPYPLPPNNNAHDVMPVLTEVYRRFLERADGREVILLGDSGGGHITVSLLYAALSSLGQPQALPLPHQLILISPNLNSEMNNPDMFALAPFDPALNPAHCIKVNRLWAGGPGGEYEPVRPEDVQNPTVNGFAGDIKLLTEASTLPTPANPSGLASTIGGGMKVVLVSAGYDVLHADTLLWLDRAEKADLKVHYIEGVEQVHDFPTGRKLIWEGRVVTDRVVKIVDQRSHEDGWSAPEF